MRVITFRINEELEEYLDRLSIIMDKSRSEIIREAIKKYIELVRDRLPESKPIKKAKHVLR